MKSLHYWPVCWYLGCAAWLKTQTCQSPVYGSSSGHPYISPARETWKELLCSLYYLYAFFTTGKTPSFSCFIIDRNKYNAKYTPHLQVYWHPSKSDKSYCSSGHTVVSFLSFPCQTSLCISPFWAKVKLVDNNENSAGRVRQF